MFSDPERSKNDFLDQEKWPKKGLKVFLTSSWQILAIMTAHNVMKMPFKCQNDLQKEKILGFRSFLDVILSTLP